MFLVKLETLRVNSDDDLVEDMDNPDDLLEDELLGEGGDLDLCRLYLF
jgi:hypothetical protein